MSLRSNSTMDFYFKLTTTGTKFIQNLYIETRLNELKDLLNTRVQQEFGLSNYDIVVAGTHLKEDGIPLDYTSILTLRQKFSENIRHTAFYIRPILENNIIVSGIESDIVQDVVQNQIQTEHENIDIIQDDQDNTDNELNDQNIHIENNLVNNEQINQENNHENNQTRNNIRNNIVSFHDYIRNLSRVNTHQCAICLHNIRNRDTRILRCSHRFHIGCINDWMTSDPINLGRNSCPTCRTNIFG